MRRVDLVETTMQAWARLDPQQRDRFFEAGLKAAVRLGQLEFRAWLLRRVKYPPLSAPVDPATECVEQPRHAPRASPAGSCDARDAMTPGLDVGQLDRRFVIGWSVQNADPLGQRNKLGQGPNLHLLHHLVAMGLDGPFGRSQRAGDLLVEIAANDQFEDLPLARRQLCETGANALQGPLLIAPCLLIRERLLKGAKQFVALYRLGEEVLRPGFHGLHDGRSVSMAREKNDRQY
jgi:hypothetical protein